MNKRMNAYPVRTKIAAGFMALSAGTAAVTGCSAHSEAAPKPSSSPVAVSPGSSNNKPVVESPTNASSATTRSATHPSKHTPATKAIPSIRQLNEIDLCKNPKIGSDISGIIGNNRTCVSTSEHINELGSPTPVRMSAAEWSVSGTDTTVSDLAAIKMTTGLGEATNYGGQRAKRLGVLDGENYIWQGQFAGYTPEQQAKNNPFPAPPGITIVIPGRTQTKSIAINVYATEQNGTELASFEDNLRVAKDLLGIIASKYDIGVTDENKEPQITSQFDLSSS